MKQYNNGQRKAMMYGGMSKRKPMMYGGMAQKKKPRKKAQAGGMMSTTQKQQQMQQNKMPMMGMKRGGKFPDLTGDGQITQADILKGRKVI
jgi:ubiquitin